MTALDVALAELQAAAADFEERGGDSERLKAAALAYAAAAAPTSLDWAERVHHLEEALRDIARGDYSDPLCQRTPEERARAALNSDTAMSPLRRDSEPRCSCCERPASKVSELRVCRLMTRDEDAVFCRDCVIAWYEEGITDPAELKRFVLAKVKP